YLIDLYLEKNSDDNITGQIRSFFILITHLAMIFSVLIVGSILKDSNNYQIIYIFSLLPLLPLIYLSGNKLKKISSIVSQEMSWKKIYNNFKNSTKGSREDNIKNILIIDYIINLFYAFMIIYLPIYLNQYLNMPWSSIGLIFAFMLLPFIIFPYPLGFLADRRLGEKEIMTGALIITSLSTILISTLTLPSIWLWTIVLFINRIGSCSVETMKESYLFKQVSAADIGIISISRNTRPLAAITGPLMATGLLLFLPFPFLFTLLGLIVLLGIYPAIILKDTR
ncbi:MAG TPA: MFS transporter, partial [Candidatus Vogelbacteria bacterium]|nr:MFS transporter [Candidatus Vogelbacteria bacterium]